MIRFLLSISLVIFATLVVSAQEICDNGIDDDGDGLIDMNDDECECAGFSSTQTVPSLIPNSSFEDHSCCPTSYSQLNCADTWIQASGPTSDFWHTCGTAYATTYGSAGPNPDGNGIAGFINWNGYKEYVGACLLSPMVAGNTYVLNFYLGFASGSVPIDITFYGTPNCGDLPFGSGCPVGQGSWQQLASVNASGPGWVNLQVTFSPTVDINALVIGPDCPAGPSNINYYYLDGLTLAETSAFSSITITETGTYCNDNLALNATIDTTGGTWQWYYEGVALVGQTGATLDVSGNNIPAGTYQAVYTHGAKCETGEYTWNMPDLPQAMFNTSSVCEGQPTTFNDLTTVASGSVTGWEWDFDGDGTIDATGSSPTYTYPSYGTYSGELIVTTDIGCTDTINSGSVSSNGGGGIADYITVNPNPIPDVSIDTVCYYFANTFTDQSTIPLGNLTTWSWDFGDGSPLDANQNTTHAYGSFGDFNVSFTVTSDSGCVATTNGTAHVYEPPVSSFSPNNVCDQTPYVFTDASTSNEGIITSWIWDFQNDGTDDDNSQNTSFTYPIYGNYDVEHIVITDLGCSDTIVTTVTVTRLPTAQFKSDFVCDGYATSFTDQSIGNAAALSFWNWDFDNDGNTDDTQQNPTFTFSASGTYSVNLSVEDANGCVNDTTLSVTVNPNPIVDFSWAPVCDGFSMSLEDLSSIVLGNNVNYSWDFGAGSSATGTNVTNVFPSDGFYDVQLTVTSDSACVDSITKSVEVWPNPTSSFSFSNVCDEETAIFINGSNGNGGSINLIEYDFYTNGTVDFTGFDASNVYPYSGSFFVSQYVMTTDGCVDTSTAEIIIFPLPEVDFSMSPDCEDELISYTNTTTISDGSALQYFWEFGDGNTSNLEEPGEVYSNPGIYQVALTATSNQGCMVTEYQSLDIYPLPTPNFIANNVCDEDLASFVDFSSVQNVGTNDNIVAYEWDFGVTPTVITNGQFPTYLYPGPGTYSVQEVVTTNHGCKDSTVNDIVIYPNPVVDFSSPNPEGCHIWCVDFVNESTISSGTISQYYWNFNNGDVSTEENPSSCFTNETLDNLPYDISLTATSDNGCPTELTQEEFVIVYPIPIAEFEPSRYETTIYQTTIDFTDMSTLGDQYFWTFDTLSFSTEQNPSYMFPDSDSGRYEICQYLESMYGCKDTICKEIVIEGHYNIYVPSAFTPNDDGINDTFFPSLYGVTDFEFTFRIFDRWGLLLYESTDPLNVVWDGIYLGESVEQDVYIWQIHCFDKYNNDQINETGHVTLFR